MRFRVLGPLAVTDTDGGEVDLGGPQQRLVLALLLAQVGYVVSTDRLIADIWGDEPPSTARKTIQGYVSNLRRAFAPEEVLVRREPGYLLDADASQVDALRFEDLLSSGREAGVDDLQRVRAVLGQALAEWSGRPYEDLQDHDALRLEIARLEELRLVTLEDRIRADVVCGEAPVVVPELVGLVRTHPLREELRVLLAFALYRAGRQTEALRAIDDARRHMATEIGVDLSGRMGLLEQRILDHDETLAGLDPLAVAAPATSTGPARNPYRGLRAFTEADGGDFFGRDELVRRLRHVLDRRGPPRLVVLAGPSGSGKSSVVRAGLMAALIAEGRSVASMYPGSRPTVALAEVLEGLDGRDSLLVVDQLEEVFTLAADGGEQRAFLGVLAEMARSEDAPWVVATIRADFLDGLLGHTGFGPLLEAALILVPPMSDHEIRSAVVEPARRVGVAVEAELVADITADTAARASALPLLQYSLTDLFDSRDGGPLTRHAYHAAGGLLGALARRADEIFDSFDETGQETVRLGFLAMVALSGEGELVRRRVARSEVDHLPQAEAVLGAFGSYRLVTFDRTSSGEATVEVAHEALLWDWPRLADWIEEASGELVAHRRLRESSADWDGHDRHPDYLATGSRLAQYADWPIPGVTLSPTEREFLDSSRIREQAQWEKEHRRRRLVVTGLAAAAVVAIGLAAVAVRGRSDAVRAQLATEARLMVSEALDSLQANDALALLLTVEAYRADPSLPGPMTTALARIPIRSALITEAEHTGSVVGGYFLIDSTGIAVTFPKLCAVELGPGRFFTKGDAGRGAVIADAGTGVVTRLPVPFSCRATQSPDGTRLLGDRGPGQAMSIVDAATGEVVVTVDRRVLRAEWGSDGRVLGILAGTDPIPADLGGASSRGELVWVDPDTGTFEATGVMAVDFEWSPDASLILLTDAEPGAGLLPEMVHKTIVDSQTLEVITDIGEVEPASAGTAWSPDGRYVGDVSRSGIARIWEVDGGDPLLRRPLVEDAREGAWITFSADSTTVAVAQREGLVSFIVPVPDLGILLLTGRLLRSPVAFSEQIAATSFFDDGRLAVVRASGIIEVVDPTSSSIIEATVNFSAVTGRPSELALSSQPGAPRMSSDRGDYATARRGDDITVVELATGDGWDVLGVLGGSIGRWVRTDGGLVVVSRDLEMVVYDRAGAVAARGQPFGPVAASDLRMVTVEGDVVAVAAVFRTDQSSNPEELVTGTVDLATLQAMGTPTTFGLPSGTTRFFLGPTRLVTFNRGEGTLRTFALGGETFGRPVSLQVRVRDAVISSDGSRALVMGPEKVAYVDLVSGRVLSTESVVAGSAVLLGDGRAAITLEDGDLTTWTLEPLELEAVLSKRDPAAPFGLVMFDDPDHVWFDTGSKVQRISIDPERWAEIACELAGRSLTEREWTRLVSEERPYDPAC